MEVVDPSKHNGIILRNIKNLRPEDPSLLVCLLGESGGYREYSAQQAGPIPTSRAPHSSLHRSRARSIPGSLKSLIYYNRSDILGLEPGSNQCNDPRCGDSATHIAGSIPTPDMSSATLRRPIPFGRLDPGARRSLSVERLGSRQEHPSTSLLLTTAEASILPPMNNKKSPPSGSRAHDLKMV